MNLASALGRLGIKMGAAHQRLGVKDWAFGYSGSICILGLLLALLEALLPGHR